MSGDVVYAVVCVIVPIAWGLVVLALSNVLDRRRSRGGRGRDYRDAPMYHI